MEMEDVYTQYKPLLLSISYQMIGSMTEAEDIVHDIFIDFHKIDQNNIKDIKSYLCKMVTNRTIDHLRSASKRREHYVGPWLPEPLNTIRDPLFSIVQHDQLSYALLTLLEKLNPVERAVFVLREAFSFSYDEIESFIGKEEANCRQILSRAKKKLHFHESKKKNYVGKDEGEKLINQFVYAVTTGNTDELFQLLKEDAILYSDGGGKVTAAIFPIVSSKRIAQFIFGLLQKYSNDKTLSIQMTQINGQPGLFISSDREPSSAVCFEITDQQVTQIFVIRNPEKLTYMLESGRGKK